LKESSPNRKIIKGGVLMQDNQKSVLIVDDIPFVRKTLKQILTNLGYRIVGEAETGEDAVRLFKETKPDIVTMDLVMPLMNGVEATRKIIQSDQSAKVVILSAMMQENLVTEAIIAGAKDYIMKPFQTDEVARVLKQVIQNSDQLNLNHRSAGGAA
jgi:two-component system chemotaxis response regulator CheY